MFKMIDNKNPSKLKVAVIVPQKRHFALGSLLWHQRFGPLQIATSSSACGYETALFNEEISSSVDLEAIVDEFDVLAFSSKCSAISRTEKLAKDAKSIAKDKKKNIYTMLGGEHATMTGNTRIADCFDKVISSGEGELEFVAYLDHISGKQEKSSFNPLEIVPDYKLVRGVKKTLDSKLFKYLPLIWIFKNKRVPYISIQASRGCPYGCSFCPTSQYFNKGKYKRKPTNRTIQHLKEQVSFTGIKRVFFEDPTAALPFDQEAHEFYEKLGEENLGISATNLVRADLYKDKKLLVKMRNAGIGNLSVGFESVSDLTLNSFNKRSDLETYKRAIEVFHNIGFSITGLFIVGDDNENLSIFGHIKGFIKEYGIEKYRVSPLCQVLEEQNGYMPQHRYFRVDQLEKYGLDTFDYTNGEFVTFFPRQMKPSELQQALFDFNSDMGNVKSHISYLYRRRSLSGLIQKASNSISHKILNSELEKTRFISILKDIEQDFYRSDNNRTILDEDKLKSDYDHELYLRGGKINYGR